MTNRRGNRVASAPLRLRDLFAQRLPLGEATGATQRKRRGDRTMLIIRHLLFLSSSFKLKYP
ncbi:hypothetical protein [Nostoc favosum]|uniref:Transposase n=1 Tax=Nostoc favosum CHAB5714 TaxID=2780399 RepID=A0ABS8I8M9_9NOSO|nr:hypothetical protein [Nostoc favosum]MCC5600506.1 hypothetical protein [Nostoc favosum CHAB5714]